MSNFWMSITGKVALIVLLCILGAAGWIIYSGMQESMEKKAGAALVASYL